MSDLSENALRTQILCFLRDFKDLIGEGKYFVTERKKNQDALIYYGITARQREDVILALTLADYSSGPHKDTYKPGAYWIFGTTVEEKEVYIKIKIFTDDFGNDRGVCFSFHPPERKMDFPFRQP